MRAQSRASLNYLQELNYTQFKLYTIHRLKLQAA